MCFWIEIVKFHGVFCCDIDYTLFFGGFKQIFELFLVGISYMERAWNYRRANTREKMVAKERKSSIWNIWLNCQISVNFLSTAEYFMLLPLKVVRDCHSNVFGWKISEGCKDFFFAFFFPFLAMVKIIFSLFILRNLPSTLTMKKRLKYLCYFYGRSFNLWHKKVWRMI